MTVTVAAVTLHFEATASRGAGNTHGSSGQTVRMLPFTGHAYTINHASGAGIITNLVTSGDNINQMGNLGEGVGVLPPASLVTGSGWTGGQQAGVLAPVTGSADGLNEIHASQFPGLLPNVTCAAHALYGGLASTPTDYP